jgi:GT2 family glycosyltransferase
LKVNPIVSVVLGTYQRRHFLEAVLETIRAELEGISHQIIIVDGGSTDGTIDFLLKQKDVILIVQQNIGQWKGSPVIKRSWGYFMNLGFRASSGKYICMLSDDCLVIPGAIKNGIKFFDKQLSMGIKLGSVAFYWRNWPEEIDYRVGITWGNNMFVNHGLYLNSALNEVGYIDESSYSFYHADGDLCLRLADKGYMCRDSFQSFIEHYSHANQSIRATNSTKQKQDWLTYQKKWSALGKPKNAWILQSQSDPLLTFKRFLSIREVWFNFLKFKLKQFIGKYIL